MRPVVTEDSTVNPQHLLDAINWATDSRDAGRQFEDKLDPTKIAVMGHSCGGIEALVAAADPRVRSTVSLDSGFFATPPDGGSPPLGYGRENLTHLHTPTLFVSGGPTDVAYQNTRANYELVTVPAVWADNPQGGHSGLWYGFRDNTADATITHEAATVVVQWLDFTLNGNASAGQYFLESTCGLCAVPGWSVSTKNF